MKLVIADQIFEDFPELLLGLVILHGADNSEDHPEITEKLRQAEAALPGRIGNTPVSEHPHIATWREPIASSAQSPRIIPRPLRIWRKGY